MNYGTLIINGKEERVFYFTDSAHGTTWRCFGFEDQFDVTQRWGDKIETHISIEFDIIVGIEQLELALELAKNFDKYYNSIKPKLT